MTNNKEITNNKKLEFCDLVNALFCSQVGGRFFGVGSKCSASTCNVIDCC